MAVFTFTQSGYAPGSSFDFSPPCEIFYKVKYPHGVVDLLNASNQKYDNTLSGLAATNIKAAIDELAANVGGNYTNTRLTPYTVGGIPSGSSFTNETLQAMWDALLYPYVPPTISSFNLVSNPSPLEVGQTFPAGNITFNFAFTNPQNLDNNTVSIESSTHGVLASGLALTSSPVTVALPGPITNNTKTSETFTIKVQETGQGILSRSTTTQWQYRVFWGSDPDPSVIETEIEGALFTSALKASRNATYTLTPAGANYYLYLVWPVSYGVDNFITKTDGTTQHPFDRVTQSITNQYGIVSSYYVYRTHFQQNGTVLAVVN